MSRELYLGQPVVDQFPVLELDGVSKHGGLGPGDFIATVYRNGAVVAVAVLFTETTVAGEYRVEFDPTDTGFWFIEVFIPYNGETWSEGYEIVRPVMLGVV